KLEPIAFDGYTDHADPDISINDNVAYRTIMENESVQLHDYLIFNLFTDTVFLNKYLNYLDKYSKPDFITNFMVGSKQEALYYDSLLSMEFPNYHHNNNFFIESAEAIQSYLPELKKIIKTNLSNGEFVFDLRKDTFTDTTIFENTPEFFVNVYTENEIDNTLEINIHNYFPQDLTFVGTGEDKKIIINYFNDKFGIQAFTNDNINQQKIYSVDTSANYLFFMVDGQTDIYSVPIMPWPHPKGETPQQELWGKIDLSNELIDRVTGKDIHIKKENITIDKPIIIPDGYKVYFYAGTKINLIDSAMIISYSPVIMIGTVKNPIVITSSDFTGNGFTVLQADGKSVLKNVVFENLNTLNYHNWTLTGSLTFYESNVSITNTRFYNNQCEDALNIIRSEFVLNNSSFEYIYGDAFDGDFCTGEVTNTSFINIGNDALDFSGSEIIIKNTEIIDAKDKGISGGEDSRVMVINTSIKNSNIGIASKDLSTVEVTNSKIETCNYGLVLLQKKPEFGPSTIFFKNSTILNSKVEMLIEKHSKVIAEGVEIKGKEKNVGEMFY
ncbi:MAG: right-handed parallel beta-helix repeat-containing protein, partial [Bacteroidota bacterium]